MKDPGGFQVKVPEGCEVPSKGSKSRIQEVLRSK